MYRPIITDHPEWKPDERDNWQAVHDYLEHLETLTAGITTTDISGLATEDDLDSLSSSVSSNTSRISTLEAEGETTKGETYVTVNDESGSLANSIQYSTIKLDNLAAAEDNTDLNATTSAHGLCPKGDNDTDHFWRGDMSWAAVSGGTPGEWTVGAELTIAAGEITVTNPIHPIDTQNDDATDDVDTINGGSAGDLLILYSVDTAREPTIKHGTGNVSLVNGDYLMANSNYRILLQCDGSNWQEVARAVLSTGADLGAPSTIAVNSSKELIIPSGVRFVIVQKYDTDPQEIETITLGDEADGVRLVIVPSTAAHSFKLMHDVDNIYIHAEADHTASVSNDFCELIYNGSYWYDHVLK